MSDLERVLTGDDQPQPTPTASLTDQVQSLWQPKIGEHVIVNFEDGWYVGEVLTEEENEEVQISFMKVKKVATADPAEHPRRFWIWPAVKEVIGIKQVYVLPVRPDLVVAKPQSSRRILIFSVENADIIDKFAE